MFNPALSSFYNLAKIAALDRPDQPSLLRQTISRRQYRSHRRTVRVASMAQLRLRPSPIWQNAPVRVPPALPVDRHFMVGAWTRT